MFHRIAVAAVTFCLVACAALPPPPGVGAGGAGGSAGWDGGGGGGAAGSGGSCSGVMLQRTLKLDEDDGVVCNIERVYVASGYVSTEPDDSVDRWSMTTAGGLHDILLTWDEMGQGFDLDLLLLDSDQQFVDMGEPGGALRKREELTDVNLTADEQFFIEVQAVDTVDTTDVIRLNYNLTVVPQD